MGDIAGEVFAILVDNFDVPGDDIVADKILDDVGVDSVAAIELADIIKERFGVTIAEDEITNKITIDQLVNTIVDGNRAS